MIDLCLFTDSVAGLTLDEVLDLATRIGCTGIELASGGQSSAPHLNLDELLRDESARKRLEAACSSRGIRISALNSSAWPMHPILGAEHEALIRSTIQLAGELGIKTIVSMSGTPGDGPGSSTFNWVWFPWPDDAVALLERQWARAILFWREMATYARHSGVDRIALELHPLHLVYNVPTLMRMRTEIGPTIGATLDPSHLFWQQMDPLAVIRELGPALYHVHLKDTQIMPERVAVAGVLDQASFQDLSDRAWLFRTIGRAHPPSYWKRFVGELAETGYVGSVSIENEDLSVDSVAAVEEAATLARRILSTTKRSATKQDLHDS